MTRIYAVMMKFDGGFEIYRRTTYLSGRSQYRFVTRFASSVDVDAAYPGAIYRGEVEFEVQRRADRTAK
jgi:hypothetical protein